MRKMIKANGQVRVECSYDGKIVAMGRKLGGKWDGKVWSMPATKEVMDYGYRHGFVITDGTEAVNKQKEMNEMIAEGYDTYGGISE